MRRGGARLRDEAGFTLIEVLAALVVFGFLIAGLAEGVRFGLGAFRTQQNVIARDDDLDGTVRVLDELIGAIAPSGSPDEVSIIGTARELVFTTTLPVELGDPPTHRADARLFLRNGALVLTLLPHHHATPLERPAPVRGDDETLATGLDGVAFSYWDPGVRRWVEAWRSSDPPSLVRLAFTFANGRRHWPPLIARPRLAHFEG